MKVLNHVFILILVCFLVIGCEKLSGIKGVIKDSKTGLWWAQDAGAPPMNLSQAMDYVRNLKLGGYNDWRLPSNDELQALWSYDKTKNEGPDKLKKMGFINVRSTCYWEDPGDYKDTGFFIAGAGTSYIAMGAIGTSATCNVWPVRWGKGLKEYDDAKGSRLFSSRGNEIKRDDPFVAFDNGTVLDTRTDLMWAAKDNGAELDWQDAKSYCENYRGGGYNDWRMPTQDELSTLYNKKKSYKLKNSPEPYFNTVHLTELIQVSGQNFWASGLRGSAESAMVGFRFGDGARYACSQPPWPCRSKDRALPVRSSR